MARKWNNKYLDALENDTGEFDPPPSDWEKPKDGRGRPPTDRRCAVNGCERKHYAKDLCRPHYYRRRDGVPLDKPEPQKNQVCKEYNCDKPRFARGLCQPHYQANHRPGVRKTLRAQIRELRLENDRLKYALKKYTETKVDV